MLSLTLAAVLAMAASFAVFGLATAWYAVPWLRGRQFDQALVPLLWIHVFRYVALQLFSAQQFGFDASNPAVKEVAYGDLVSAALAVGLAHCPATSMVGRQAGGVGIRPGHGRRSG